MNIQQELLLKSIELNSTVPLERCWAIRNYIGTATGRYDVADDIGAMICDLIMKYVPSGKMKSQHDDNCAEYWDKVKLHLRNGR